MMPRWLPLLLLVVVLAPGIHAREPRYDPSTGRVRVIYLGDSWGTVSPIHEINRDPRFVAKPIPASAGHLGGMPDFSRWLRIYMPRTYSVFVSSHDVVILSDTQANYYTDKQLSWFVRGVEEDSQGLIMVGGRETQLGGWGGTTVEDVLPADFIGLETREMVNLKPVPRDPDHELVLSLPIGEMPTYTGLIVFSPKSEENVILESRPLGLPILLYHEYGTGSSMIHAPDWTPGWGMYVQEWEFFDDWISNIFHMLAGLKIPQDPVLMHALRTHFGDYEVSKRIALSSIEFADKFGANTRAIDRLVGEIEEERSRVTELYIEQDYQASLEEIVLLLDELVELQRMAIDLKDSALLWVYITEVCVLTGTSLITGGVVWILMVRRRLYRDVETTRPTRIR
jgi:uncharacterized membrane protein